MTIGKPMRVGKLILVCISDLTRHAILKIHNFDLHDTIPEFTPLIIFEPIILDTSRLLTSSIPHIEIKNPHEFLYYSDWAIAKRKSNLVMPTKADL